MNFIRKTLAALLCAAMVVTFIPISFGVYAETVPEQVTASSETEEPAAEANEPAEESQDEQENATEPTESEEPSGEAEETEATEPAEAEAMVSTEEVPAVEAAGDEPVLEALAEETITITYKNGDDIYETQELNSGEAGHLITSYPTRSGEVFLHWIRWSGGIGVYYHPGQEVSFEEDITLEAAFSGQADGSEGIYAADESGSSTIYRVYNGNNQRVQFFAKQAGNSYTQDKEKDGYFKFDELNLIVSRAYWYVDVRDLDAAGKDVGEYFTPVSGAEWAHTWPIDVWTQVEDKYVQITQGTLKITERPILVKTADADVRYGDVIPTDGNEVKGINGEELSGVVEGESIEFAERTAGKVGKGQDNLYTLAAGANTKLSNYKDMTEDPDFADVREIGTLDVYYELTYDANGGTGAPDAEKSYEESAALSDTAPTRDGYIFKGWAESADATSAAYQPGETISLSDNTTLYAVWQSKECTITYDLAGGTYNGSTEDIIVECELGDTITIHEAPTREGYEFVEWQGSSYQPGDIYAVTGDHTFTAVWEATDDAVDTGDPFNIVLWLTICGLALVGSAIALFTRRRNYQK